MIARTPPLLALAALAAGCGGDRADVELTVTAPQVSAELLPGATIEIAWTLTGDAEIVVTVTPLEQASGIEIHDELAAAGDGGFTWDGRDTGGALVPPDVYDLEVGAFVAGDPVDAVTRSVAVHGITITDPAPGATRVISAADGGGDLHYRTVSQRAIDVDTTLIAGTDELLIDHRTVPGEFVPFVRDVHFTGSDLGGAPIPAGIYTVVVDARDPDSSLAYRVTGGMLDWRP